MYFVIDDKGEGMSEFGETLADAYKALEEQGSYATPEECKFFEGTPINVIRTESWSIVKPTTTSKKGKK